MLSEPFVTKPDSTVDPLSALILPPPHSTSSSLSSADPSSSTATSHDVSSYRLLFGVRHPPGALPAFGLLFAIHLTNYADRFIPSAVKAQIQAEYDLDDFQSSFPLTVFIIAYMIFSPLFGYLSDRGYSRTRLIAAGVVSWSVLTALTAAAPNYAIFVLVRAAVGIGEASYIVITPSILADYYQVDDRNRMIGLWSLAIPLGAALGFGLGGVIGEELGWKAAFVILGLPGIVLGLLVLRLRDPVRGGTDPPEVRAMMAASAQLSNLEVYKALLLNPVFVCGALGQAFNTFGAGGVADWMPTYIQKSLDMSEADAGLAVGAATVVGGIGGGLFGPWLAQRVDGKIRNAYLAVAGWTTLFGAVMLILLLQLTSAPLVILLLAVCEVGLWAYLGPVWALFVNAVHPLHRTRAAAIAVFIEHLLGDAASPSIIGAVSDRVGLSVAMVIVPATWTLAGMVWLGGSRWLEAGQEKEVGGGRPSAKKQAAADQQPSFSTTAA